MDLSNITFIDLEGTGTDVVKDRITQVGLSRGEEEYVTLVNPGVPIPVEVQELTGITDAIVKDAPAFKDVVGAVLAFLGTYDLAGFNIWQYDLPLLAEECGRAGKVLEWRKRNIIDAGVLFKKKEERTLSAAMRFYCHDPHDEAHSALADAKATRRVLEAQLLRYADLSAYSAKDLSGFTTYEQRVDLAGKLTLNKEGQVVYNFGKSKGVPVTQEKSFGFWMLDKDFPSDTKTILRKLLGVQTQSNMAF